MVSQDLLPDFVLKPPQHYTGLIMLWSSKHLHNYPFPAARRGNYKSTV
jgi:hypothetical protein